MKIWWKKYANRICGSAKKLCRDIYEAASEFVRLLGNIILFLKKNDEDEKDKNVENLWKKEK